MKAIALTDQGLVRPNNEDTIYCSTSKVGKFPNLFVVADGMGGANAGEYASAFLIKNLTANVQKSKKNTHLEIMRDAIENANKDLYNDSLKNDAHRGCGTTLVTAIIEDNALYVSNVGDSRLYVIGDKITQITKDHSYVEEMVKQGRMVRGSADYVSKKNIITRAIGTSPKVLIDFFEEELKGNETILLCTDGLSDMMDDATIFEIVKESKSLESAAQKLIEAANEHGGNDNVSVVLISELDKE